MSIDLKNINFENINEWPLTVKIATIAFVFFVVIFLGYWFDTRSQKQFLDSLKHQEPNFKQRISIKYSKFSNLQNAADQVKTLKKEFGVLLAQMPEQPRVSGLLDDISKLGVKTGLRVKLLKPRKEIKKDFYAEIPIDIEVQGNYHQLATFLSDLAKLDYSIAFSDFIITKNNREIEKNELNQAKNDNHLLTMDLTIDIYRHVKGQASG